MAIGTGTSKRAERRNRKSGTVIINAENAGQRDFEIKSEHKWTFGLESKWCVDFDGPQFNTCDKLDKYIKYTI